ncbi:virB8 family protein [Bordetella petrii]|uniref:virB8 family protein n=1 Tax=Bordetella petrii TaxID=94624 RepID=UPI00048CC1D9|nr:type IV secretion system protein [Bordetella petrii]
MPSEDPKLSVRQEVERKRGLERDLLTELLTSRRVAWRVAVASLLITAIAITTMAKVLFLFEPPPPVVVRVNDATGEVEYVTRLGDPVESYGERTDKSYIHQYVLACESYDWNIQQNIYDRCGLFSSPEVRRAYLAKFEDNPKTGYQALDTRYGKHTRIVVNVRSITMGPNRTATVRFTRRLEGSNESSEPEYVVATLAFNYINSPMKQEQRWINPLGFTVTTYNPEIEVLR